MDVDEAQDGDDGGGAPAWMATFSDLATLLLTFFVLLLSFANMDIQNFKTAMGSVKEAMGVQFKVDADFESLATSILELSPIQSGDHITVEEFAELAAKRVRAYVEEQGLSDQIAVDAGAQGVVLRTRDTLFFDSASADVRPESSPTLNLVADLFGKFDGDLSVQGHTDSIPIHSSRFPSNWELSTARATAVMRALTEQRGLPVRRVHVAGYADTRPVVEGDDLEARTKNRRVEFLFMFPIVKGQVVAEGAFAGLLGPEPPKTAGSTEPVASGAPVAGSAAPPTAAPSSAAPSSAAPFALPSSEPSSSPSSKPLQVTP
ncbi:MAG: OmpA family protein [Myxococcales bacterium]|nr:OmpA family protein [Myxococcales bacterium]